jgi:CubicO group peptidase (beta-lactamase class C family)
MRLLAKFTLTIATGVLITFAGCKEKDNTQLNTGVATFQIDTFVAKISAVMNDPEMPVSGYQFLVSKNGNLYHQEAGGFMRHRLDRGGEIRVTTDSRFNVASVSKFVGAICIAQLAEKYNFSFDDGIVDYLPQSWQDTMHPAFKNPLSSQYITFRDLLRMRTSISFPGSTPPSGDMLTEQQMKAGLANTPNPSLDSVYQNGNFTLIRVLVGEIEYKLDADDESYSSLCTEKYFEYLKNNIFDKVGINPPSSVGDILNYYSSGNNAYAYQFPFDSTFRDSDGLLGWNATSNPYRNGGSGGLVMNAQELGTILAYLLHDKNETLLSNERTEELINLRLGLLESPTGKYGVYPSKGGTRGPDDNDRAIRSRIMIFPNNVEAVLLTNCDFQQIGSALWQNYDDSHVIP